jgi:hypothetical protein
MEISMNQSLLAFALHENVRAVDVAFFSNSNDNYTHGNLTRGRYTYKTTYEHKVGDVVVVMVGKSPKAVKVMAVDVFIEDESKDYKWIMDTVNTAHYKETLATEQKLIKKVRKVSEKNIRAQFLDILGLSPKVLKSISFTNGDIQYHG